MNYLSEATTTYNLVCSNDSGNIIGAMKLRCSWNPENSKNSKLNARLRYRVCSLSQDFTVRYAASNLLFICGQCAFIQFVCCSCGGSQRLYTSEITESAAKRIKPNTGGPVSESRTIEASAGVPVTGSRSSASQNYVPEACDQSAPGTPGNGDDDEPDDGNTNDEPGDEPAKKGGSTKPPKGGSTKPPKENKSEVVPKVKTSAVKMASVKPTHDRVLQAAQDLLLSIAREPSWEWARSDVILKPMRSALSTIKELKESTDIWKAWTTQPNFVAYANKHFNAVKVDAHVYSHPDPLRRLFPIEVELNKHRFQELNKEMSSA